MRKIVDDRLKRIEQDRLPVPKIGMLYRYSCGFEDWKQRPDKGQKTLTINLATTYEKAH